MNPHAWARILELDQLAGVHRDDHCIADADHDDIPELDHEQPDTVVAGDRLERRRTSWRNSKRRTRNHPTGGEPCSS